MMRLSLQEVAALCDGSPSGGNVIVTGVSTDSRQVSGGSLFVALQGPRFDAHEFIDASLPAAAVMVNRPVVSGHPRIRVKDTRLALGALAAGWRRRCPAEVVALTGSNGKTTVKEMLAAILQQAGDTLATQGNLNNEIGVPLTLLRLSMEHRFAVIEMGANHAGEIAGLTALAGPRVALITNAGPAHLEGFGSLEGVARAKGEIFQGLGTDGVAVINADDAYAQFWMGLNAGRRTLLFGSSEQAQVRVGQGADGKAWIRHEGASVCLDLALPGAHNRLNAAAAAAAALALGLDLDTIAAGLASLAPVPGRLMRRTGPHGINIIDDSYNANPASTRAAVDMLLDEPAPRILVLGDMGELGGDGPTLHRQTGEYAAARGIDRLLAVGPLCRHAVEGFGAGATHFKDREALIHTLQATSGEAGTILVKGSRGQRMERIVEALITPDERQEEPSGSQEHAAHSV
ncbi:UDP-N-acetylmuramoyl-tripeptide--D-alanyl-D-alanine ligase [Ectothiorhodospira marina]|jgi:UDP-N-acetylmuramoyl-tripeptide--D-alanyl-D-alanine ligase|uniref:UDP-N-acetylmuramoyl-tripeptide--D-alanyl-D-alanine ligase n=1 Tax=Ectothiorhodospira marina TaxID=1396821 RepID=A0A1H7HBA1_9GAMM|nr:UDP-N-acetylmuramoyl-tripeptide--D-alanyl-D-alanine ligase [Ectothiorhodospira marina]SEK47037.1 UDP-N-acetylmuramoyl-tripeptide--D-alanyl-D-alanine ligase [Ectothiorhodospira marina]